MLYYVVKTKLMASKTRSAIATGSPPTEVLARDQVYLTARMAVPSCSYVNRVHNTGLWLGCVYTSMVL